MAEVVPPVCDLLFRPRVLPLQGVDWALWNNKEPPPRKWLVEGMIPFGCVTSLYGHGGVGKSLLALNLAVAAARSSPPDRMWLSRSVHPATTVALLAEEDEAEVVRRVRRVCAVQGVDLAGIAAALQLVPMVGQDATLVAFAGGPEPILAPLWARLEATIEEHQPGLIVLDYAAAVFGGDEVRRDQVSAFLRLLNALAERHGAAILLLGHPSADGMKNGRGHSGSTGWHNHARAFLHLEADDDARSEDDRVRLTLTVRKQNYGRSGDVLSLAFDGTTFEMLADKRASTMPKGPKLTRAQTICLQALRTALDEGGQSAPVGPFPQGVRCVSVERWRRHAYAAGVSGSNSEASRRRAFLDTRNALQDKGLVAIDGEVAWMP